MDKMKIHFLNTIWSDAIILEKDNHYAFIDTATDFYYPMIVKHLKKHNIEKIDFIILTHFHGDHYGNVLSLINDYNVGTLYLKHYYGYEGSTGGGLESDDSYINNELNNFKKIIETAVKNQTEIVFIDDLDSDICNIDFNGTNIELYRIENQLYNIYNNINSKYYKQNVFNENQSCIGVFFKVNNFNIFLGADLICMPSDEESLDYSSIKMIKDIYNNHDIKHIDIYKTCHHGHYENNPQELCDLINADYAIITNSTKWTDNYSTIPSLKKANNNVKILHTDHQKYIFTIDENINYEVIEEESLFIILNKN